MLKQSFKLSLTCVAFLALTPSFISADGTVAPENSYNFSNTSPVTFDQITQQYQFPTADTTQASSTYPEDATLPAAQNASAFAFDGAAFSPYRYIRADVAMMFKKYDEVDAGGQQAEFEKTKTAIGIRAGMMLRRHFGVEGRFGLGLGSETKTYGTATSEYKTNGYLGIMGRGQTDLGNGIVPYANLGLMAVKNSFESRSGTTVKEVNNTTVGLAGAIGVEVNFRNDLALGIEAAYLPTNVKTISATVGYNF